MEDSEEYLSTADVSSLLASIDRLTADNAALRDQLEKTKVGLERERHDHKISCRAMAILVGDLRTMFNVPQDKELMPVIKETLAALTHIKEG